MVGPRSTGLEPGWCRMPGPRRSTITTMRWRPKMPRSSGTIRRRRTTPAGPRSTGPEPGWCRTPGPRRSTAIRWRSTIPRSRGTTRQRRITPAWPRSAGPGPGWCWTPGPMRSTVRRCGGSRRYPGQTGRRDEGGTHRRDRRGTASGPVERRDAKRHADGRPTSTGTSFENDDGLAAERVGRKEGEDEIEHTGWRFPF